MSKILLHVCCGPCAIHPVQALQQEGFQVTGLFYNPNIHPLQEYVRRRDAAVQAADTLGIKLIVKDEEYDPPAYFREIAFRETNRCFHCYQMRMERTHQIAKRGGFDAFSTTLLYSKKQKHEVIRDLGRDLAGEGATTFHYADYRDGWQHGIETSKAWGLYRQNYCGCLYSENERFAGELTGKQRPA